jgi:CheY-like chemotaxis protein
VAPPPPEPGPPPLPPGAARVLRVDDEPLVGRAVARILSPPHRVTVVTSGEEALERLSRERYDVVLCDLMMPGLTGMDLHQRLEERWPELAARVIFLTGGAFTEGAQAFLARVPNPRLEKPFEPGGLRQVVAAALGPR